jgi:hypothetical protein
MPLREALAFMDDCLTGFGLRRQILRESAPSLRSQATSWRNHFMKASDLFVKALESEGVEYLFGIAGEENAPATSFHEVFLIEGDPRHDGQSSTTTVRPRSWPWRIRSA